MNIIALEAANIKKIKAIKLEPKGESVVIGGENEMGKSSVLDCILFALAGEKHICDEPLRRGAEKGFTKVNLGELLVERRVTKGGTTLVVTNAAGDKKASPQSILDTLKGILTFDPLAFSKMEPKLQRELLAKLVGIDFGPLTAEYDRVFGDRTLINREVDKLRALFQSKTETPGLPEQEIKTEDVLGKLDAAQKHNSDIFAAEQQWHLAEEHEEIAKTEARARQQDLERLRQQIVEAEEMFRQAQGAVGTAIAASVAAKKAFDAMKPIDAEPLRIELREIGDRNAAIRGNAQCRKTRMELQTAEAQSGAYTKHLDSILEKKRTLVEQAKFPLPGLAITDDAVLFEGLPLQQASSARQIKISAAIGMALNPKLRVMIIREGSLLDAKSLAALQDLANSNDFQLWIERVGTGKEISVVIEDGEVAENRL